MRYYAGIGSRDTPNDIQESMADIAILLERSGYTLRSGHADGADLAFASRVQTKTQIWLPYEDFNFNKRNPNHTYIFNADDIEADVSVNKFHPNPSKLSDKGRLYMSRNYRQIVGKNGEPNSEFVICWTPDGKPVGGTAQAIRIANSLNIPVYNLAILTTKQILWMIDPF